jgi:aspartyl-tRNA(Asn)/glutamyl-tRNA(Gln) amidotransferase subunit A
LYIPLVLGVVEAAELLQRREASSRELVGECLARIDADDVTGAWIRVYVDAARAAAAAADERLAAGEAPLLCGIPIGLKDLYAAAGFPLTASSELFDEVPTADCTAWARLRAQGMVLLGHVHTHEFAAGGTTDQVANPWDPARSAGGSSGGSAAALAAGTTPAATGTDTAGSLRIPSAFCGTATIKPTRGLVPVDGIVPLAPSLDHAGPMARTVADCEPLLAAMADVEPPAERRPLRRIALSPRIGDLDPDVAARFDELCARLPLVHVPAPEVELDVGQAHFELLCVEMREWHRRFDDRRDHYKPSTRAFLDYADAHPVDVDALQARRRRDAERWLAWFDEHDVDAIVEPTVPIVPRVRGRGYDEPFSDVAEVSLTYYWNWVGFPVVAFPTGLGVRSGLPTSASLIGRPGADWDLLAYAR